jgi:hypothetical protein
MTLEALLARIYTDADERARFLADPQGYALAAGLDPQQAAALTQIDRAGLTLAARTFAHKRGGVARTGGGGLRGWLRRIF